MDEQTHREYVLYLNKVRKDLEKELLGPTSRYVIGVENDDTYYARAEAILRAYMNHLPT